MHNVLSSAAPLPDLACSLSLNVSDNAVIILRQGNHICGVKMEELINKLINISMERGSNVKCEVNQLLDVNLGSDSNVQVMREKFEENLRLCQGVSRSSDLPQVPADSQDRIDFVANFYEWIPEKPEVLRKFMKNSEVSADLRLKANELFEGKRDMLKAMRLYNLAIMFAEPTGEELGLAFANRSALLLEQQDPEGALKDMDLAVKHNYPERLMPKLQKRREKCLKMLEDFERSYLTEDIKADMAIRRKYRDELFKLKNPNPLIPCAEDFVRIQHTDEVGRHLVVTKDLPAGTVVVVERPFTSVNKGLLKFEASYCDSCNKYMKNGIPCKQCIFIMYCSEACRSNAEQGHHKFECSCLSSLYLASTDPFSLMAFRILCKVGPEEFYRLFATRDPNYFDSKKPFGTEPNCKYESDSYLPIHHLVGHSNTLDKNSRYTNALSALQLTSVLEARTKFFHVSPEDKRKEFKNFIAAILLRLEETLLFNGLNIEDFQALQGRTLADIYRLKEVEGTIKGLFNRPAVDELSLGIYSVGSLLNNSCDPSVGRLFDGSHGTMALWTTRALKKGETLTTVYGMFEGRSLIERQMVLLQRYCFECQCVACKNDWPTDLHMTFQDPEFTCPTCSKKFGHEEKGSNEFLKCCLTGSSLTCGICAKSYKRENLNEEMHSAIMKYFQASNDMDNNRPIKVVEACKEVSAYFQFNICPPHSLVWASRGLFHNALALILQSGE